MSSYSKPAALNFDAIAPAADLVQKLATPGSSKIVVGALMLDNKPITVSLVGQLPTGVINVADWGAHSLAFTFDDEQDMKAYGRFTEKVATLPGLDATWTVKDPINKDRLYLKLKTKNDNYTFKTNLKLNAKKPGEAPLIRYQSVEVQADVKLYFSFDNKTCGMYLDIFNINFGK